MRIAKSDLDRYGYHEMCAQCRYIQTYGHPQPGRSHSEKCRKQFVEAMSKAEHGRARLAGQEERVDRRTSEFIEQSDRRANSAPTAAPPTAPAARSFANRKTSPAPRQQSEPHPLDSAIPAAAAQRAGVKGAMGVPSEEPPGETPEHPRAEDGTDIDTSGPDVASKDDDMHFIGNLGFHDE